MIAVHNSVTTCPACGLPRSGMTTLRACREACLRRTLAFMDAPAWSSLLETHLHVTCTRCGFEWLEHVHDPVRLKELL